MLQKFSLLDSAPDNLPLQLREALPAAEAAAERNITKLRAEQRSALQSNIRQLNEVSSRKVPAASRVIRVRHLAGEQSALARDYSACRKGCSHCCHISAMVPLREAKLIAKAINKPLSEPKKVRLLDGLGVPDSADEYFGTPCTFLVNGSCSIYQHRPLVCRTLVNMDDTEELCKLVPGVSVPVPYLNTMDIQLLFVFLQLNEPYADIREWFPASPALMKT